MIWIVALSVALLVAIAIYELNQRQHAILRTFPIIGHLRYCLVMGGARRRARAFRPTSIVNVPNAFHCETPLPP